MTCSGIYKLVDFRQGKAILRACLMEARIIDAGYPLIVGLRNQHMIGYPIRVESISDKLICVQPFDLFFQGFLPFIVQGPSFLLLRREAFIYVECMAYNVWADPNHV